MDSSPDKKTETISVLIPTYNRAESLRKTVDSILSQKLDPNVEFVIVDDNSTDTTKDSVVSYLAQRINEDLFVKKKYKLIYLLNKDGPQGPSNARNLGIVHATGDYIFLLDSDDLLYDDDCLQALYRSIKYYESVDDRPHFVYGDTLMYSNLGSDLWEPRHLFSLPNFSTETLAKSEGLIPTGSFLFTASIATSLPWFNEDIKVGEDFEWQLRVAAKYPFRHINKTILKYYRGQSGQLSTGNTSTEEFVKGQKIISQTKSKTLVAMDKSKDQNTPLHIPLFPKRSTPATPSKFSLLETELKEMVTDPTGKVPVDLYVDGEHYSHGGTSEILWVVTEPRVNLNFLNLVEKYKTILTFNCALSHRLKKMISPEIMIRTMKFPFSEKVFPFVSLDNIDRTIPGPIILLKNDLVLEEDLSEMNIPFSKLEDISAKDLLRSDLVILPRVKYFNTYPLYDYINYKIPTLTYGVRGPGFSPNGHGLFICGPHNASEIIFKYTKNRNLYSSMGSNGYWHFRNNREYSSSYMIETFSSFIEEQR